VLCTSGTAATHLHGAVVEAHLSGVPLIVLTADRPPELRDVGAPQTIDQTRLFGSAVRWFHDPGVPEMTIAPSWRGLARQAYEAATGLHPGPVHLNLPFREPLVGTPADLPRPELGPIVEASPALRIGTLAMAADLPRGVIVAGRGVDDPDAVRAVAEKAGWPVLADPRSGCRGTPVAVAAFDSILRNENLADMLLPEVVLHLGEPPASKVLGQWLRSAHGVQISVNRSPAVIDPLRTITHRVTASPGELCRRLAGELGGFVHPSWLERWTESEGLAQRAIATELGEVPELTEVAAARAVTTFDGHVVVASSMPIRDVEWFGAPAQRATMFANRGANGIDGIIATATGVAVSTGRPVAVLLGDVAFLHDSSSLTALSRRGADVRIVVIDNDGGGIFSFLPQATALDRGRFEQLFGTPHGTDLVSLANAHDLPARTVTSVSDLALELAQPGPRVIRVESDRATNVVVHRRITDAVHEALTARFCR
jgi:2-succinyl-5-enolpyruvyl-6-hydroxy-3-cyclohexene-1-carboxylate synthase